MKYRLAEDVVAEPLILQWYISPWLIAPTTAAFLWIKEKIPLLENYLSNLNTLNDAAHWNELQNGQFVHLNATNEKLIAALLNVMLQALRPHREFVDEYQETLDQLNAKSGESLAELTASLPQSLRGYSEIERVFI